MKNPEVDTFLSNAKKWQREMAKLRTIVLDCGLKEELKWRQPCYTLQKSNVVLIGGFKEYCALTFFKGVLLYDKKRLLKKPGENTQSSRLIHFTSLQEIIDKETILKAYIQEAIDLEKAGVKPTLKATADFEIPEEFKSKLNEMPALQIAFDALTPGRQRAYILHFSGAKQSKTRASRVEKYTQRILDGIGLNDCTCGLSKKPPYCDGSHKQLQ